MSIIQISKIQVRSGNLVDLPQLDDAELGWASDDKKLFIGKTDPNENVEILTSYSNINFDAISGSYGNLDIDPFTAANGQALIFNGVDWVNRGGDVGGLIDLGDVSNVKISGGSIGYVLETDGTGNLSWGPKGTTIAYIQNVEPAKLPTYATFASNANASLDYITIGNATGFTANAPVTFTGTPFGNIANNTVYYIKDVTTYDFGSGAVNVMTISSTINGANLQLTDETGNLALNMVGTILTTTTDNFFTEGAEVTITGAVGMTELNGNTFYVDLITSNTMGLFLDAGLTQPLYSNNYSNYAYTNLVSTTSPNLITVGNTAQFSNNSPIRFVGDLLDSGLALNTTFYIKNIQSSTELVISASIANGMAGNAYPVNTETFVDASMYEEGGRVLGSISGSTATDAAGANTTIQYNAQNQLGGSANLRFNFNSSPVELILVGTANMSNVLVSTLLRAPQFTSNIATGTAPLVVSSNTKVTNLNADLLDGYDTATTATANTVAVRDTNASLSANFFIGNFTGTLSNGNSSISIPAANGNVNISAVGNANVLVVTGTGVNVTGTLNATGNANTGNLGTAQVLATANVTSPQFISNIATGTAPLVVTSTTKVANLNADTLDGYDTATAATANTVAVRDSNGSLTANVFIGNTANITGQYISTLATGNAPLVVTSTTKVANLNADTLDGYDTATAATANTVAVRDTNGNLSANFFIGNGSQLTGLITSSISNGNSNVSIPAANGNVNISAIGNANVLVVTGTGVNITGTLNTTGNITGGNLITTRITSTGNLTISGSLSAGNWTTSGIGLTTVAATYTDNNTPASATVTNVGAIHSVSQPTLNTTNSSVTYTDAATFYIANGPANGSNVTISNRWSLYIANGNSYFGGTLFGNGGGLTGIQTSQIANGNSNVSIPAANGNVNISSAGNQNILVITGTGANIFGTANISGNTTAGNFIGPLANGNSNVRVFENANITFSSTGTANVVVIESSKVTIAGNLDAGNLNATAKVIATGNLEGNNACITNRTTTASLVTANITAPSGNITISANGTNETIYLVPTGTGVVDVGSKRITQLGAVTSPTDATTKEYVDAIGGTGLTIHSPANVSSNVNLAGTYANGGSNLTTTTISGGKTITFSGVHGLSENDGVVWANTFNGITGGEAYWVYSVANTTSITIKDGYFGAELTTLTNGTGLTQAAKANPGVGATLTNSGANAALTVDGIAVTVGQRVLLYSQSLGAQNGVYTVTNQGSGAAAWVLTRATDMNKYIPGSTAGIGKGDYLFINSGSNGAGTSWVVTSPADEIIIGTDSITFTQFSSAGAYTAANGINITGSTISANVDNVTTAISGGNIVVKVSANLTTPNIGAAVGNSLTVTDNISANNISISNLANVTGNITTSASVRANGTVEANGNVSGLNLTTNGNVVGANLVGIFANGTSNISIPVVNGNIFMYSNGNTTSRLIVANDGVNVRPTFTLEGTQSATNWGTSGIGLKILGTTYTGTGPTATNGTVSNLHIHAIAQPTINYAPNSNVTITNASTLYIDNSPNGSANINSITNSYALYINAGDSYLGGPVKINGSIVSNTFIESPYKIVAPTGLVYNSDGGLTSEIAGSGLNLYESVVGATLGSTARYTLYVVSNSSNYIYVYTIDRNSGLLTFLNIYSTGTGPRGITIHPTGKYLYVVNNVANTISQFGIDQSTGQLTSLALAIAAGTNPLKLVVDPTGKFLFAINAGSNNISSYTISQTTGELTFIANTSVGTNPGGITIDPTGRFLYVTNSDSNTVSQFSINLSTGVLTSIATAIATGVSPRAITVEPSGRFVYVGNYTAGTISLYTINSTTGALSLLDTITLGGTNYSTIVIDPTGRYLYVGENTAILICNINQSTGNISLSSSMGGFTTRDLSIDPTSRFLYQTNSTTSIYLHVINNLASGSMSVAGNISVQKQIISSIATGTAPLVVTSTTKVANLNADTLDGYDTATAATANTVAVRDANGSLTANFFLRSVTTSISAAGTVQSNATALSTEFNVVSTVATGAGVRLPTNTAGMAIIITNTSANNLLVYPPTSGIINSLAANASYTQPSGSTLQYIATSSTQWYTVGASYA